MKIAYDKESDIFTMILRDTAVDESDEIRPGVIIDFDISGSIVGIEILDASKKIQNPNAVELAI